MDLDEEESGGSRILFFFLWGKQISKVSVRTDSCIYKYISHYCCSCALTLHMNWSVGFVTNPSQYPVQEMSCCTWENPPVSERDVLVSCRDETTAGMMNARKKEYITKAVLREKKKKKTISKVHVNS